MTRAVKGARSRRVCRGCPERPSQEVSDGWFESPEASREGGPITASTGPGQKSHVERRKGERTRRRVTQDASPRIGLAGPMCGISNAAAGSLRCATNARRAFARAVRSMRRLPAGHKRVHARLARARNGGPIGVRRRHPSATGAPHAPREGAAKKRKEEEKEKGEAK